MYEGNYLVHHGRLGQKWGKKNGPPYPLDYSKLSSEEREKAKGDAIARGDVKEAYSNRAYFTSQEIEAVMSRFNTEQRLKDLSTRDIVTGKQKAKNMIETLGTVANTVSAVTRVAKSTKEFVDFMNGNDSKKKKSTQEEREYTNGKLTRRVVNSKVGDDTLKTTYNFEKKKNASFKSEDEYKKIMSNLGKYSDEDIKKIADRRANINRLNIGNK